MRQCNLPLSLSTARLKATLACGTVSGNLRTTVLFARLSRETIEEAVAFRRATVRLIALIVMIMAGSELVLCDIVSHTGRQTKVASSQHSQDQSDEDCGCTDGCLCCCSHFMVSAMVSLPKAETLAIVAPEQLPPQPYADPTHIYRPPRA